LDGMKPLLDMNEWIWNRFKKDLGDVTAEESDWRPVPQANTINIIVRHLRIEAEWHLDSLERGEQMPAEVSPSQQQAIDAVPLDFQRNLKELDEFYTRFIATLRDMTLAGVEERSALAYAAFPRPTPPHLLGFHQTVHLAMHLAQIRTIRTLYIKMRGEAVPARYYPDNASYLDRTKQSG